MNAIQVNHVEREIAEVVRLRTDDQRHDDAILRRALGTADFVDHHFEPGSDGIPGLRDAGLPADTGPRLRFLAEQIEHARAALADALPRPDLFRLRNEARRLRLLVQHAGGRDSLAAFAPAFREAQDAGAWMALIAALADLAAPHAERAREIPGLASVVDDARALLAGHDRAAQERAAALRALAILLHRTIAAVHRAADVAFRRHPRLVLAARLRFPRDPSRS